MTIFDHVRIHSHHSWSIDHRYLFTDYYHSWMSSSSSFIYDNIAHKTSTFCWNILVKYYDIPTFIVKLIDDLESSFKSTIGSSKRCWRATIIYLYSGMYRTMTDRQQQKISTLRDYFFLHPLLHTDTSPRFLAVPASILFLFLALRRLPPLFISYEDSYRCVHVQTPIISYYIRYTVYLAIDVN